ncbi:MAG: hypothetical protein MSG64_12110 [Pyrinomonadaceae bacterium MAG19_C2-C3]|nr:hypothetical protein [Pyrinomonadaceae bacterium MAG19_C2-C3]
MATTIEGTWEEITQHAAQLAGHRLRVTVLEANEQTGNGRSVDGAATLSPNFEMLQVLERSAARLKDMRETSGVQTQEFLRNARSGGMFADGSDD